MVGLPSLVTVAPLVSVVGTVDEFKSNEIVHPVTSVIGEVEVTAPLVALVKVEVPTVAVTAKV